ncbi:AEC family transporter [Brevibacterium sp. 5221]|uniref:AEC family transporter n=1 Tax=Brevibacterium rongguiense TaxID=2695267 RepID=A0A6N9HAD8_9MICO|nr:AEC family transporter [Brevibacterium rongguiense]MYM20993.1 AEC family transporter [Brevibacterium rongguiense]
MIGALEGFGVIAVIVFAGWLLGRSEVLGETGQRVLAGVVFYAGTPALLYVTLAQTAVEQVFSPALLATAGSAVILGCALFAFTRWRGGSPGAAVMSAWSVSYVNIGNLGIPIATYVLGSLKSVAPVLLFQLLVLAPIGMAILDASRGRGERERGQRSDRAWWQPLLQVVRNPIIIGACLGLVASITGFQLPHVLHDPIEMIGNTSVPLTLMAFGISLKDGWALPKPGTRSHLTIMTVGKLIAQPVLAWAIGGPLLGFTGGDLMAIVVTSALPTAQNVYVYALRYRQSETITRDVVFITTILSVPTIILAAILFG